MFYIGQYCIKNPYLLAPMAGVSEMPFRVLAFEMGAGLATTELVSAKGLIYGSLRTKQYLTYHPLVEQPFSVQLFGGEPEVMAKAAQIAVESGAQIIDINMGCPVKKVTKTGAGSALLCDPMGAHGLLKTILQAVGDRVPVTAKIRSGWDLETLNYIEVGRALEEAGCGALAIHARTRSQGYSGSANWEHIKALKETLTIPIIGNGDVMSKADALRMKAQTGCDGVMIGRGALGNPWIFKELSDDAFDDKVSLKDKKNLLLRHFEAHLQFHAEMPLRAIRSFRPHFVWYSKGLSGASHFRQLMMQLEDKNAILEAVDQFFENTKDTKEADLEEAIDYRQAFG